jgi:hypothetical protein
VGSTSITDRNAEKVVTTTTVGVKEALDVNLTTGDIQIGAVEIKNGTSDTRAEVNSTNSLKVFDSVANSLVPAVYDWITLSWTGEDLTGVVFKNGGSSGSIISTLTLTYSGGKLVGVGKS